MGGGLNDWLRTERVCMLLVGRHSVTRSDMVVIKKAKERRQRKLRYNFRVSSFARKRETEGKTPRITPDKKRQ